MTAPWDDPYLPSTDLVVVPDQPLDVFDPAVAVRIEAGRRARRLPYLATAATAAAGYTGWGVCELAQWLGGDAAHNLTELGTTGVAALAVPILRLTYRGQIDPVWRRRWWLAATSSAGWVSATAALGPNWTLAGILAAGSAALAARWVHEHEVPRPPAGVDPVPLPELEESLAANLERRWALYVAGKGQHVPGGLLTNRTELPRAVRWTITTPPGTQTFRKIFAKREDIAGALHTTAAKLIIEPSEENEGWAELTIITRDLLSQGVPYLGPRYDNGEIDVGVYADGTGRATFTAYDNVGVRNGLATGDPGSGKSVFLGLLGLALRWSGEWQVIYGDGDPEAGSSPLLNEVAHWAEAGPVRILAQLEAFEKLLELRAMIKTTLTEGPNGRPIPITDPVKQRPLPKMLPCPEWPGYAWILDEFHRNTHDPFLIEHNFAARVERITRLGRKYGIAVIVGTQSLLAGDFGNKTTLRGHLATRNLFAFRTENKSEKATVSGLDISPSTLPVGGGYAFSAKGGRLAMLRTAYHDNMFQWAPGPDTHGDTDSELAIAPFRPKNPRDPAAVYAEQIARLEKWRTAVGAGKPAAIAPPRPLLSFNGIQVPAALTAANIIPVDSRRPATPPAAATSPSASTAPASSVPAAGLDDLYEGPDLSVLNPRQRRVYDAVVGGARSNAEMIDRTGLPAPAVSKALKMLAGLGYVHKIRHGAWAPGPGRNAGDASATATASPLDCDGWESDVPAGDDEDPDDSIAA